MSRNHNDDPVYANSKSTDSLSLSRSELNMRSNHNWTAYDTIRKNDEMKSKFIQELMCRYDFLTEAYQAEVEARKQNASSLQWRKEKETYDQVLSMYCTHLERDPFILVLIDGNDMLFDDQYLREGEAGGYRAAAHLTDCVKAYIQNNADIPSHCQIVCRIYADVRRIAEALFRCGIIVDSGVYQEFTHGFTRAGALFDFVDVGPGNDLINNKLIETFKLFSNDYHCRRIFFGCSHNNASARALEKHATDDHYLRKVVLLKSVELDKEPLALPFTPIHFEGLFRDKKLIIFGGPGPIAQGTGGLRGDDRSTSLMSNPYYMTIGLPPRFSPSTHQSNGNSAVGRVTPNILRTESASTLASNDAGMPNHPPAQPTWAALAAAPAPPVVNKPAPHNSANREDIVAKNRHGQRVDQPCCDYNRGEVDRVKMLKLCNVHYLREECPYGDSCSHRHDYPLSNSEKATLRLVARMAPCQYGSTCTDVKCIYGHRCPAPEAKSKVKGTKRCIFGETCKFPTELHNLDCNVVKTLVIR